MPHDIFISYSRRDLAAVKPIKQDLESLGFSCWMDLEDIGSGTEEFTDVIASAIQGATTTLFFLSDASQGSRWSLNELRVARDEGRHVVLVRFNDDRMQGKFKVEFGGSDVIDWRIAEQKEKLLKDLRQWSHSVPVPHGQSPEFSLVACPLCGKKNVPTETFRCRGCGLDDLCLRHQDSTTFLCPVCIAKKNSEEVASGFPEITVARNKEGVFGQTALEEAKERQRKQNRRVSQCPICGTPAAPGSVLCEACGLELPLRDPEKEGGDALADARRIFMSRLEAKGLAEFGGYWQSFRLIKGVEIEDAEGKRIPVGVVASDRGVFVITVDDSLVLGIPPAFPETNPAVGFAKAVSEHCGIPLDRFIPLLLISADVAVDGRTMPKWAVTPEQIGIRIGFLPPMSTICWTDGVARCELIRRLETLPMTVEGAEFNALCHFRAPVPEWQDGEALLDRIPVFSGVLLWLVLRGIVENSSFAEAFPWWKLDGNGWVELLAVGPQFADRCPWKKLNDKDWERLLAKQPQFASKRPRKRRRE